MAETPLEIDVGEVAARLQRGDEPLLLIDCREPEEWQIGTLPGAVCLAMSGLPHEWPAWKAHLERASRPVIYCHHGVRSARVALWLRQQGVSGAQSMAGGIERWAIEVDPETPRY